jgi:monofunctional biosynthetic peptidoglycan transglycosylase
MLPARGHPPVVAAALVLGLMILGGAAMGHEERVLVDFRAGEEKDRWIAINDGVMGGVSLGRLVVTDSSGVFSGHVSLENNGGFASVRRQPQDHELRGAEAIRIRVKGDGKIYRFRIKTDDTFDGAFYQTHFETRDGEWTEHTLPLHDFYASFRGRRVDAPALDGSRIRQIGFLIAEKQAGPFRLEIEWVKADVPPSG